MDYCVMYDNYAIGQTQAQFLVDRAEGKGNNLYMSAGAAGDGNAMIYLQANWSILQPKVADGTFKIVNSSEAVALQDKLDLTYEEYSRIMAQITQNWNANDAINKAESFLASATDEDKGVMYCINPNGGCSRAIYDTLITDPAVESVIITGQDAEPASVQYVIDGKQSMDVLKDTTNLVNAALNIAKDAIDGKTSETNGTMECAGKEIPTYYADYVVINQENVVKEVFDSGYYNKDDYDWTNFPG